MRMHIEIDDDIVDAVDRVAGRRGRSRFIRQAVESALDNHRRQELIRSARASIPNQGHEWDGDVAEWVRRQRRADIRRTG